MKRGERHGRDDVHDTAYRSTGADENHCCTTGPRHLRCRKAAVHEPSVHRKTDWKPCGNDHNRFRWEPEVQQVQAPSPFGSHFAPTQEAKTGSERMTPTGAVQVAQLYHRVNSSTHDQIVRDPSHNTVMVWSGRMLHETGEKCERVL